MGDMADYYLDSELWFEDPEYDGPGYISCNKCGKGNLSWLLVNNKWKLVNSKGSVHVCKSPLTKLMKKKR